VVTPEVLTMRRMIKPVVIIPALAGIILSLSIFLKIWERRKVSAPLNGPVFSRSSLPAGALINLATNVDSYATVNKGRVLLVFLTTNCDACKRESFTLSKVLQSLNPNTDVYGVCFEEREKVIPFVKENGIKFPVLLDKGGRVFSGLGLTVFPAKVLMQNGTIIKTWFGSSPSETDLIREIDEANGQR
jgi:peroxiredoxin